ncbi:MAG TPA: hypothetical protein VGI85_05965 [Chthoniobacterales bacterium]|jgi:hypothetical protein
MGKWLIALLLCATPTFAQDWPTAYQAMRTVGTKMNRDLVNHVISITGKHGTPQPETWTLLLDDSRARGGVREVEVAHDQIVSERTPLRSSVQSSLGPVVDTGRLNLDSSGAYTVAQQAAASAHLNFATADYTLHVGARGNPVWIVTLQRGEGEAAGKIFIAANDGTITRTEGLFGGGDQVTSNEERRRSSDDGGDPIGQEIQDSFRTLGHDAKRDFNRVRQSFVNFFTDK